MSDHSAAAIDRLESALDELKDCYQRGDFVEMAAPIEEGRAALRELKENAPDEESEPPRRGTVYDIVELPESEKGAACPMLTGDEARRCNEPVEFVFVQDANADPDDDRRVNTLCCADCKPEPQLATDGGQPASDSDHREPEWRYAVDHDSTHDTRAKAVARAAIVNRGRDDQRRDVEVWAYKVCACDVSVTTFQGGGRMCGRCKGWIEDSSETASEDDGLRADGGTEQPESEQLTVEEIESRPHPNRMDNEAIWEEKDELVEVHEEISGGHLNDLINERWGRMLTVLEQRIDPDYPECPHCESSGSIGYAQDGVVVCKSCYQTLPEDVREQYREQYSRVWGNDPDDGGESDAE